MAQLHPLTLSVRPRSGTFLVQLEPGDYGEGSLNGCGWGMSCGLFLLFARDLEHQESPRPACCPPRLLQALHGTLQVLPHGQGWLGRGPHSPCRRGTPRVGVAWPWGFWECCFSHHGFSGVSLGLLPKLTMLHAVVAVTPWVLLCLCSLSR